MLLEQFLHVPKTQYTFTSIIIDVVVLVPAKQLPSLPLAALLLGISI